MLSQKSIDQIRSCTQCNECVDSCPTFRATGKEMYAPPGRLAAAEGIIAERDPTAEEIESICSCPQCGACELVCPEDISLSALMNECRRQLVVDGFGPLEKQMKVIGGLQKKGNSVNGDPAHRWDWLPEAFPRNQSDTLFYAGCLPAYLVKNSARSSYLVLKTLGVDFMLDESEDCCGIYYYNAGRWDLAEDLFSRNRDRFKGMGIKRIITTCAGCFHCFKYYYPRLIPEWDLDVVHLVEILPGLLESGQRRLRPVDKTVTFLDSCRLGRKEGLYDPPRKILEQCGITVEEPSETREQASCCGAGAGIRSIYPQLSLDIALRTLDAAPAHTVTTSCPFCSFNLSYAVKKGERDKDVTFITDLVLEALSTAPVLRTVPP